MHSEISQAEKDKYCMISLTSGMLKKKKKIRLIVTEQNGGTQGLRSGGNGDKL